MNDVDKQNSARLDSWKAIAAHLQRDEGTLRRWEQTRGLPIRRVPGKKGASVFAFISEIDAWLQSDPPETTPSATPVDLVPPPAFPPTVVTTPPRPARRWVVTLAVGALAIAGASLWWWLGSLRSSPGLITLSVTEEAVIAKDSRGRTAWTHRFAEKSRHIPLQHSEHARIVLGSRPQAFVATEIQFRRSDNLVEPGRLTAFGLDGVPQWHFEFDDTLRIAGKPFGAPWGLTAFAVNDQSAGRRVAVAGHHYQWSASLVAILDADGRRLGRFVNDGWLEALQWVAADRLAVSGFSQSRNGGLVALIDPGATSADAQSPESDPAHQCNNCGAGRPLRMAVMPRTELNLATGSRFNRAILEHVGDRLVVRTVELSSGEQPPAEAIYEFTASLELVRASFSERYWEAHDQLFAAKRLDHDRTRCPDRAGPRPIEIWSPERGWASLNVR